MKHYIVFSLYTGRHLGCVVAKSDRSAKIWAGKLFVYYDGVSCGVYEVDGINS